MDKILSLIKRAFVLSLVLGLVIFLQGTSYADDEEQLSRLGAGANYSGIVQFDGSLLMWGNNRDGRLGKKTDEEGGSRMELTPELILKKDAKFISLNKAYHGFTALIKKDGSLWTTGDNNEGQLGDGTTNNRSNFKKILDNVAYVSLGLNYGMAVKEDGSLWAWGDNYFGQFCDGTKNSSLTPTKVMDGVKTVHAGYAHTAIVKTDGSVLTCGDNREGQLGNGSTSGLEGGVADPQPIVFRDENDNDKIIPIKQVAPGEKSTLFLLEDGSLRFAGAQHLGDSCLGSDFLSTLIPVEIAKNVRLARKAYDFTVFVTNDNDLYICGYGHQYCHDDKCKVLENVDDVQIGIEHSLALTLDGTLWAWGSNGTGECGLGFYGDVVKNPTQVKLPIPVPEGLTLEFNGKKQVGVPEGVGYTIKGNKAKEVGNYKATLTLAKDYKWTDGTTTKKTVKWKIVKAPNTLTVTGKQASVKFKKVKNADQFIARKNVMVVKQNKGEVTFQKTKGNKNILVDKVAGSVKVSKGMKKGTYNIKVKVTATGNAGYKVGSKVADVVIIIK